MLSALSYIGAHWFLILSVVGIAAGLSAFAWFTKNWKAALAAIVLVFFGLAYQSADLGGYKRRLNEEKAQEIALLHDRLATMSMITSLDTQRVLSDAKLNTQLERLAFETPPNAGACLDRASARRVRSIGSEQPLAAPTSPRRHSSLFQKRSERP